MDVLDGLDPFQLKAVTHPTGPLLVVAGPGSGKTRVLTRRAAWLVSKGVSPTNILLTAFNKEAAGEMERRLSDLLGNSAATVDCRTIHSTCLFILKSVNPALIRRRPDFGVLTNPNFQINKIAREIAEPLSRGRELLHDTQLRLGMERMTRRIALAKENRLTPDRLAALNFWSPYALQVYVEYERHLERENFVDFGDFLCKAADLLEQDPDTLHRFQQKWTHVLVDEYQDVSVAQEAVFYNLCKDSRNITAVGDADQAIYGFRGGTSKAMLTFHERWPDSTRLDLPVNYRSTQTVVGTSQRVIRNNRKRFDYEAQTPNDRGPAVAMIEVASQVAQAKRVVETILNWLDQGERLSEMAVLYRTRRESRPLELNLFSSGVYYRLLPKSDPGFYGRKETLDVVAWIKLVLDPNDDAAFERAIQAPRRGVGESTLKRIKASAGKDPLYLCVLKEQYGWVHDRIRVGLDGFVDAVEKIRGSLDRPEQGSVVGDILDESSYLSWAEANTEDGDEGDVINALYSFEDAYLEFVCGRSLTRRQALSEFLEQLRAQAAVAGKAKRNAENSECVTLSTMHSAKGKEFTNVIIVGCYEGNTPLLIKQDKNDAEVIEDERRLFYVGITRCRRLLSLFYPRTTSRRGNVRENEVSRFLIEAEEEVFPMENSQNSKNNYDEPEDPEPEEGDEPEDNDEPECDPDYDEPDNEEPENGPEEDLDNDEPEYHPEDDEPDPDPFATGKV